jgi:hypothetical protein
MVCDRDGGERVGRGVEAGNPFPPRGQTSRIERYIPTYIPLRPIMKRNPLKTS